MRSLLSLSAVLLALALPLAANAAPVTPTTTFILTPTGGSPITFSYTGVSYSADGVYFNFGGFANGNSADQFTASASNPAFYLTAYGAPLDFQFRGANEFTNGVSFLGVKLYTGAEGSPTFVAGTYTLAPNVLFNSTASAQLVISNGAPTAPPATPEPSSLILLGTGALGIAGAARRRFVRA